MLTPTGSDSLLRSRFGSCQRFERQEVNGPGLLQLGSGSPGTGKQRDCLGVPKIFLYLRYCIQNIFLFIYEIIPFEDKLRFWCT